VLMAVLEKEDNTTIQTTPTTVQQQHGLVVYNSVQHAVQVWEANLPPHNAMTYSTNTTTTKPAAGAEGTNDTAATGHPFAGLHMLEQLLLRKTEAQQREEDNGHVAQHRAIVASAVQPPAWKAYKFVCAEPELRFDSTRDQRGRLRRLIIRTNSTNTTAAASVATEEVNHQDTEASSNSGRESGGGGGGSVQMSFPTRLLAERGLLVDSRYGESMTLSCSYLIAA